jgi:hypothetical protein
VTFELDRSDAAGYHKLSYDFSAMLHASTLHSMMKYDKPLLYSAIAIIYASFTFRILRLGLIPRTLKPASETKTR